MAHEGSPVPVFIALPTPTEPYAVGRTECQWVDATRVEPFTDDPAEQRELVVWVWYPADSAPDA